MTRGFRTGEFVREHARGLRARPWRALLVALCAAVIGAAVPLVSLIETGGLRDSWEQQRQAGRFVEIIRAGSITGFPMEYCENIARTEGVIAVGAILHREQIQLDTFPGQNRELLRVSPGMVRIAWPGFEIPAAGIVAGRDLATQTGLVAGTSVTLSRAGTTESRDIVGVAGERSRVDGLNSSLLEPDVRADQNTRECFVEFEPGAASAVLPVLRTAVPEQYGAITAPFLTKNALVGDPEKLLPQRASNWAWVAGAGVIALLLGVLWWSGRSEMALYRAFGVRPIQITLALALEVVATLLLPVAIGAAAVIAVAGLLGTGIGSQEYLLAGADIARLMLALLPLPLLGTALASAISPSAVFKGA
ncbi:hypothetical protein D9V32_11650 [Mycetocola tolaasinivorans]|uniref:ABC transporter permease n=1 Tax=Mycetocola tolaasinivorans TaxID=76635 RepID=A0A3L7A4D3_9MICO|nr:hypothetical protein [Mycetocola tolaasinivorans]RLP75067.1 hypothetical protein D9V32_11650 [Mycetocola tolaasinivorans]